MSRERNGFISDGCGERNCLKQADGKAFATSKSIQEYVTSNIQNFFQLASGSRIPNFITEDPDVWENDEVF